MMENPGQFNFVDGDLTATTFFANIYYDFKNTSSLVPYLGAGLGFAIIDVNDAKIEGDDDVTNADDTVFAYQVMAGVAYVINQDLSVDLSYRYVGASDPEMDDQGETFDYEFGAHNILLGVRYTF